MFPTLDADFCWTLRFTTDCTYFVLMLTTSSDADWIRCFAHSFHSQTVRALFFSPSSNTYWVGCFAHLQQVTELPWISLYLMLIMSCILLPTNYTSFVLILSSSDTKSGGRLVRSQDVCALFLILFYLMKTHTLLACRPYVLCFNAPSSLADWIEHFAFPQIVCALIQCSFHFMLTKSDALLSHSSCVPCFNTPLRLMLTESDALPNNRTYYQEISTSLVWPDSFDSTKSGWRHILSLNIGLA